MKSQISIYFLCTLLLISGCKSDDDVPPMANDEIFMLAIVNPDQQVPLDFEADQVVGDYNPNSQLLRVQGTSSIRGDKIEITVRDTGVGVPGTYPIGEWGTNDNVRVQYISNGVADLNTTSLSGTLVITKYEAATTAGNFLLWGTFSFKGTSGSGEVEITSGEIQNAVITQL